MTRLQKLRRLKGAIIFALVFLAVAALFKRVTTDYIEERKPKSFHQKDESAQSAASPVVSSAKQGSDKNN